MVWWWQQGLLFPDLSHNSKHHVQPCKGSCWDSVNRKSNHHTEPHKSKCQYSEMQKIRDYNCEPQQGLVFPRSWQHEGQALTFAIPSPSFPRLCICQTLSARPIKCCPSWFLNPGNPWVLMYANSLMRLNMFDFLGMHILCIIQWGEGGFAILLQR